MKLEIREHPDPILREKSEEIKEVNDEIRDLIEDMFETMYANEGVGLSGVQVGVLKRISVVDTGDGRRVFINPKIVRREKNIPSEEGCLSLPGVLLEIKRAEKITVEALNERGEKFELNADGLLSRCIQHEIDHLDGVLILDRISLWDKIKNKIFSKS